LVIIIFSYFSLPLHITPSASLYSSQKIDFLWSFSITVAVVQQRDTKETGEMINRTEQDLAVNHTFVMS
jgi:spore germination protein YaaH